jgi:2-oxoglutarate ferredoxin oxidoreductase subunit alpha
MTEYIGLAYYTETPVVIWNVQRAGPSTGLPTRTAQGDLTQAYFLSHGDTQYIILIPGNINECFDFGWQAFDYAEHYQTPVIVLSDLDLGMNQWMAKEFEYPAKSMDRGKIVWENGLDDLIMRSNGKWGRYLDIDNDGIPYRTLPGNKHHESGYFSRGTGHDEYGNYTEDPFAWKNKLDRLHRKIGDTREKLPQPVTSGEYISRVGIISMGSTDCAIQECRDKSTHKGTTTDYLRVRAIPFSKVVEHFIQNHDRVYVIEINHDGQLRQLLSTEYPAMAGKLISISKTDGLPLTAGWILNMLESYEGKYER